MGPGAQIEDRDYVEYDEDNWVEERVVEEPYVVDARSGGFNKMMLTCVRTESRR